MSHDVSDGSSEQGQPETGTVDLGDAAPPDAVPLPDAVPPLDAVPIPDLAPPPDLTAPCAGLTCPLKCNVGQGRCFRLDPSNFDVSGFYGQVSTAVSASGPLTFNTGTGQVSQGATVLRPGGSPGTVQNGIYWGVVTQGAGYPELAVFGVVSLIVPAGQSATVSGSRAFALYATQQIDIAGTLVGKASGASPGPGGFAGGAQDGGDGASCPGSGHGLGGGNAYSGALQSGGGGGGRKAKGGSGGEGFSSGYPVAPAGAGGSANGVANLIPLYGGCGGGGGGGPDSQGGAGSHGGPGGGGGGALELAADGPITISGVVNVAGAGGAGGAYGTAGGGGGSGGAVLLEGTQITVTGVVAANGGGGGAGTASRNTATAPAGQDGQAALQAATGGPFQSPYGGAGGNGGVRGAPAGKAGQTEDNGGGGGGAVGRIRCNAPSVSVPATSASPAPTVNTTVNTW